MSEVELTLKLDLDKPGPLLTVGRMLMSLAARAAQNEPEPEAAPKKARAKPMPLDTEPPKRKAPERKMKVEYDTEPEPAPDPEAESDDADDVDWADTSDDEKPGEAESHFDTGPARDLYVEPTAEPDVTLDVVKAVAKDLLKAKGMQAVRQLMSEFELGPTDVIQKLKAEYAVPFVAEARKRIAA